MNRIEQKIPLKLLAEGDRPREKMAQNGRRFLSNAELIAILLGSGSKNETAVQLAQRMLNDNLNDLNNLAKLELGDLMQYHGVGEAKAVHIAAAFELGRRRKEATSNEKIKIHSSQSAFEVVNKHLCDLPHEEFIVLYLNRANHVIKEEFLSKGGIGGTVVDIKIICKKAIENYASGIILSHNHPSGNISPSLEDRNITKKIKEALNLFDVQLLDHLIIGDNKYLSFCDEGLL